MAKFNTENSTTLSRFAKDKRVRTAAPKERTERGERNFSRPKRASYNPHFTEDNRLRDEYSQGERSERPARPARPVRPGSAKPFGKRTEGGFKSKPQGRGTAKPYGKRNDEGRSDRPRSTESRSERPRSTERRSYPKFNPNKQTGEVRLNRFVAQSGICSRREADELIAAGLVSINGEIVTELGSKVKPGDEVRFNGERIQGEKHVHFSLQQHTGA
ncbi:MAG: RNA-binding S4 domain-containing protein, partial [Alistipes sp.]|nr:RNA-binding S4 domain-containing protein [Alistipes sp.]